MSRVRSAAVVLCLAAGCGGSSSTWSWSSVGSGRGLGTLAGFSPSSVPNGTSPALEPVELRGTTWDVVETPGARGTWQIAADGTEFSTSYGIYQRSAARERWRLLPGSRALDLAFGARDAGGTVYAVSRDPAGGVFALAPNAATWAPLAITQSTTAATFVGGASGPAYVQIAPFLYRLENGVATRDEHPDATTFDLAGERYVVPPLGSGTAVQHLLSSGRLETWVDYGGAGTSLVQSLLGFGADGRFYAISGANPASSGTFDFADGDVIAISPDAPAWAKAASSVVDSEDERTGPPQALSSYRARFAPDGALFFYGCEAGCSGNGNEFSLGVYRLALGSTNASVASGAALPVVEPTTVQLARGLGRATTLALGVSPLVGGAAVWVTTGGGVVQRTDAGDAILGGIQGARAVGLSANPNVGSKLAFAATASGAVYRWSFATAPVVPVQVAQIDGVVDLAVSDYAAYALGGDGRVWLLPLDEAQTTATVDPALADVVAVRVSGRYQQFQGGAVTGQHAAFVQSNGLVHVRDDLVYDQNALPPVHTETTLGPGLRDVTATGVAQSAAGRAAVGSALVHRAPVLRIDGYARAVATSSTNSEAISDVYCLFDDGALWQSTVTSAFGENQQGAGTSSTDVVQVPVRAPGDADVTDFVVVGAGTVVVWTRDGATSVRAAGQTTFAPATFTDLRAPGTK